MQKKKYILRFLLAFFLGITLTLFLVYYLYTNASKNIAESDKLWYKDPNLALEKLEQAKRQWPLLNFDENFKTKLKMAKQVFQDSKTTPSVTAFLKDQASNSQVQSLIEEIKKINGVKKVNFVSKEEAFKIYQEQNKNDPALLELVTVNILPASIEIYLDDFTLKAKIAQLIKNKTFVSNVIKSPYY